MSSETTQKAIKVTTRIRTTKNGKSKITEVNKPIKEVLLDLIKWRNEQL